MHADSATALLARVVDYAGLFPPAALGMPEAVAEYVRARAGRDVWMLGRFVVPASRLTELRDALTSASHTQTPDGAQNSWRVSAIVRDGSEDDVAAVSHFNAEAPAAAAIDSVESAPASLESLSWLSSHFASIDERYVELPAGADAEVWMPRLAQTGCRAKVRTGGLQASAFPPPEALLGFIAATLRHQVPFKATAGLHHAVCGSYALTYERDAASARMFGFLNLLLATAALQAGLPEAAALGLLTGTSTHGLTFSHDGVQWGTTRLPTRLLRGLRERHLVSFGSCSFREPADEFRALAS